MHIRNSKHLEIQSRAAKHWCRDFHKQFWKYKAIWNQNINLIKLRQFNNMLRLSTYSASTFEPYFKFIKVHNEWRFDQNRL